MSVFDLSQKDKNVIIPVSLAVAGALVIGLCIWGIMRHDHKKKQAMAFLNSGDDNEAA